MHPLIRTSITLICFWSLSTSSFARTMSIRPVKSPIINNDFIPKLDSFLCSVVSPMPVEKDNGTSENENTHPSSRICSCQVLNLESSNYNHRSVVLLSEKTYDGTAAAYSAAKSRLIKEKKHLKKMF